MNTVYAINDPNNCLKGTVRFAGTIAGVGLTNTLTKNGGANLDVFCINTLKNTGVGANYSKVLSADESVSSSTTGTTYVNSALTVTVPPGTWRIQANCLFRNGSTAPGAKMQVTFGAGTTFLAGHMLRFEAGATANYHNEIDNTSGYAEISIATSSNPVPVLLQDFTILTTQDTTVLTVQYAQLASSVAQTTLKRGSLLQATRLD